MILLTRVTNSSGAQPTFLIHSYTAIAVGRPVDIKIRDSQELHPTSAPTLILQEFSVQPIVAMRCLTFIPALFGVSSFAALLSTEFPHLIVPLVSTAPNTAYGTQYDATISYSVRRLS